MIIFLDGTAEGTQLSLARAPFFLRVVVDAAGEIDALDQLDDTVRPGETAFVYHKVEDLGSVIMCSRGKGCRTRRSAAYQIYATQPDQAVLCDNARWQSWAIAEAEQMLAEGGE